MADEERAPGPEMPTAADQEDQQEDVGPPRPPPGAGDEEEGDVGPQMPPQKKRKVCSVAVCMGVAWGSTWAPRKAQACRCRMNSGMTVQSMRPCMGTHIQRAAKQAMCSMHRHSTMPG